MKKQRLTQFKIFAGLVFCVLLASASPAFAVNIQPIVMELTADPGETAEEFYYVRNDMDDTVVVDLHAEPWRQDSRDHIVNPDSWLSYEPRVFYLGPQEVQEVKLYATALESETGELRAILYFDETQLNPPPGMMVINRRLGSVVYLGIMGTMVASIDAIGVLMNHEETDTGVNLVGKITFENPGNIHIRPQVNVVIENESGFYQEGDLRYGPVAFPGASKDMVFRWEETKLDDGVYTMTIDSQFYGDYVDTEAFELVVVDGAITVTPVERN